jgi:uncharacterized oligopeptide transporter (OPT) family protein
VLKFCSSYFRGLLILGADFGVRENNIVVTVAQAAGGLSSTFTSAIPALYQMGLLETPLADFWRITMLTALGCYFAIFFATPCESNVWLDSCARSRC